MKKIFVMMTLVAATLASCNFAGNSDPNSDDKDSIDAARSADSLIQSELNADTSANSNQAKPDDSLSPKTDSMNNP